MTSFSDYSRTVEQEGIEAYRCYINEQMAQARETRDPEKRSLCLANVVAANGMLLRGMEVGFVTGEINYRGLAEISQGIRKTQGFRSLMEDSGERLAQAGDVDTLVNALKTRDSELSEGKPYRAIDLIRGVQTKVRAHTAQPRDYAIVVAAHRLSSRRGKTGAQDGRLGEVVRRDLNRQLDGKQLSEETYRVLTDPDFRYVMEREKPESLYYNTLRANGVSLEQYPRRAAQLRSREKERESGPQGQETADAGPGRNSRGAIDL